MMGMFWTHKCWSARGMSGHESAGPPKGMFYLFSKGTLPCVKSLVTYDESVLSSLVHYLVFCFGEDD
jgi:hypothetical protein